MGLRLQVIARRPHVEVNWGAIGTEGCITVTLSVRNVGDHSISALQATPLLDGAEAGRLGCCRERTPPRPRGHAPAFGCCSCAWIHHGAVNVQVASVVPSERLALRYRITCLPGVTPMRVTLHSRRITFLPPAGRK
jgi:hypothetical protein